jgi:hypothetical protein
MHKYQRAITVGMNNVFDDIERLKNLIKNSFMDKKYIKNIEFNIDRLKHVRKFEFLEAHYEKIDNKIKELYLLLALTKAYWYDNEIPKEIYSMHNYLSSMIKKNYAMRNKDKKYLVNAIQACEKQIALAKNLSKKVRKGIKKFTIKSIDEIMANSVYNGRKPVGFDPAIHKSPNDFILIPGKLGEHTGYKQLCITRENQGNFAEVIRLAEQAKSEGWEGDWDKRIEKARKKLEK